MSDCTWICDIPGSASEEIQGGTPERETGGRTETVSGMDKKLTLIDSDN